MFDFALVTLKVANFALKRHFCPLFTTFNLHFPLFHFFILKNGLLSLFTLVTLNMVSPPLVCKQPEQAVIRFQKLSVYFEYSVWRCKLEERSI